MPITTVKCEWTAGLQRFYMSDTFETVNVHAPASFEDEFLGTATLVDGTTIWSVVDVSVLGATTPARVADGENGVISIMLDGQNEDQDSIIYWGDEKGINFKDGCIFEFRANVSVLPTGVATLVAGIAGDHNLVKDTVTEGAWFRWDGSGALDVESDDTTNNNDDVTTGLTTVAGAWHIYRIDSTVNTDVKFFVDGVRVAKGTTFDMSNLSDAEGIMQPYFSLDKTGSADLGTLQIDYVRAWWKRV